MKTASLYFKRVTRALMIILSLGVTGLTNAHPVDIQLAREVGTKFINASSRMNVTSVEDLQLVTTYRTSLNDAAFYVFNTTEGFVIISADDCAMPILGYSDEGHPFDPNNVPIQMQEYLQGFVEQIAIGIENHLEANEQTARQWELVRTIGRLAESRTNERVLPLLSTTWDQGCYYNVLCPEDPGGSCGHVFTGCTATAMAQIMHYWGYPEHGTGSHSYTPSGYPEQNVDFWATTYDWDNMPNNLNGYSSAEQINAVATLMWHCGVSVDMNYGINGSAAFLYPSSLINYFDYSDEMTLEYRSSYSDASWKAKLKDCLNLNRPVYYVGYPEAGGGHAFVCDGYDSYDLFHFNWGWDGLGNGFFFIDDLVISCLYISNQGFYVAYDIGGYNYGHIALFNIHPQTETTNYVINVSANNEAGGTVSGGGNFTHGSSVTLSAIANNGYHFCYWEENGGIASTNPNYSFPANFNRNLVAVFAEPFTVTVTATEGGAASGGGSFPYGQSCTVTATADEGYGFANWTRNGEVVSFDANYTYPVTSESLMTAHFVAEENIEFADNNVKAICVANWDSNGDGELSYVESAVVTSLGEAFRANVEITSFDELQYFISLTSIDNYAFCDCTGLNSIEIPNSVTAIRDHAFCGCIGFTGDLIIPNSVTAIEDYAFCGCNGFTGDLIIPNSVTTIGRFAFSGCSGFTGSLTIPNSVIKIEREAFSYCSGFNGSLTIPNSVRVINIQAFSDCSGFTSLTALSEIPAWLGLLAFQMISTEIPVYVPSESLEVYQQADGWNAFSNIIGICSSRTISVSADPANGGTISGAGTYTLSQTCTLIASANSGFVFSNWTENDSVVSTNATYSFMVTGNRTLVAHFVANPTNYTITVSANPSNGGFVSGGGTYQQGQQCTVSATANSNYTFVKWTENGTQVSTNPTYSFTVSGNRTLVAHFQSIPNQYTISLSANPSNGGTVSGAGNYTEGQTCTAVANANPDFSFVNWTENGVQVSTSATYSFTVTGNRSLVANFQNQPSQYTISLSANPTNGGTVSGGGTYSQGQTCTVTANANPNYSFVNWTENGTQISANSTYSFTVTGNRTLVANFSYSPTGYVINVTAEPSYGGLVSGAGTYNQGQTCTLIATPNPNYDFVNWTESGNVVSTDATYSFTVNGNRTLVAHFESQVYTITVYPKPTNGGTVYGSGEYSAGITCHLKAVSNPNYTFLNWSEDGVAVSGEADYSFVVTGNRTLVANFFYYDAVEEDAANNIIVYPNPTNDLVFIKGYNTKKVELYDLMGQILVSKESLGAETSISTKHLSSGLYLLRVYVDNDIVIVRVAKE